MNTTSQMKGWGEFNGESPCPCLTGLRKYIEDNNLSVYSEHGEEPSGWVNVHCPNHWRTYEVTLKPPFEV